MGLKSCAIVIIFFLIGGCNNIHEAREKHVQTVILDSMAKLYDSFEMAPCIEKGMRFTKLYPKNSRGWQILGGAYLYLHEDSLSELSTKMALSLDKNNHVALTNYAIILDNKMEYNKAERYYRKAIELNPKLTEAYSNFAGNRLLVGDYQTAVKMSKIAVVLKNRLSDKAVLCISYNGAGMFAERDSLFKQLKYLEYPRLAELSELFKK